MPDFPPPRTPDQEARAEQRRLVAVAAESQIDSLIKLLDGMPGVWFTTEIHHLNTALRTLKEKTRPPERQG